jgi:hypothetical protein
MLGHIKQLPQLLPECPLQPEWHMSSRRRRRVLINPELQSYLGDRTGHKKAKYIRPGSDIGLRRS